MKILVLSFYFQPDLCAGSFRTTALVEELKHHPGTLIDVITTLPNRYASFSKEAQALEISENVKIRRIALPSHKSGMLDQIKSFITFYRQVIKLSKNEDYDLVFATSSRLFTAFLGARVAKTKNKPLYLDIRDIFVDTIKDVLPPKLALAIKPFLSFIEKYTFSSASHINLVSKGFDGYFKTRYPSVNYSWFTNGIDNQFLNLPQTSTKDESLHPPTLLYAGNIGDGQGLHKILPELTKKSNGLYQFNIIGDGGKRQQLIDEMKNIRNIKLLPPVNREMLIDEYLKADILFLHLNDYPAFEKVLPSKIFEYAATGRPILAGVSGYAAKFIESEVENAEVFYPGDHDGALKALSNLKLVHTDRALFVDKYMRSKIMKEMSDSIIEQVISD